MPEMKELLTIRVVTDDDTGMWRIGEVSGMFQVDELTQHLEAHGKTELLEQLAYIQYQVISRWREIQPVEIGYNNIKEG